MLNKSLTEIRAIAQSMGVKWDFSYDKNKIIQLIEAKRVEVLPDKAEPLPIVIVAPPDVSELSMEELLQPFIKRGLHWSIIDDGNSFFIQYGVKEDSGTIHQSPRDIIKNVIRLMT